VDPFVAPAPGAPYGSPAGASSSSSSAASSSSVAPASDAAMTESSHAGRKRVASGDAGADDPDLVRENKSNAVGAVQKSRLTTSSSSDLLVSEVTKSFVIDENDFAELSKFPSELDRSQVVTARKKELVQLQEFGVYRKATLADAKRAGSRPISTRWVDVQKDPTLVRSRLVAREYANTKRDDCWAATPALLSLRLALSLYTRMLHLGKSWTFVVADVSVAFLHAPLRDVAFVIPPAEAGEANGVIWRLEKALYGMRAAPSRWQQHLCSVLSEYGIQRSKADPCVFFSEKIFLVVHVDDFAISGETQEVRRLLAYLKKHLLLKVSEPLAPNSPLKCLGRDIYQCGNIVYLAGSTKLINKLLALLDLKGNSNAVSCPWVSPSTEESTQEALEDPEAQHMYRSAVGILAYLSHDRPDLQFTAKALARALGKASVWHLNAVKRAARYVGGHSSIVLKFHGDWVHTKRLHVYSDSDWACCKTSRKSTSGGAILLGQNLIVSWSRTQNTIATSSAEAELYSSTTALAESLFVQTLINESFPRDARLVEAPLLHGDASAALAILGRTGLGKLKHVDIRVLWTQDLLSSGRAAARKIPRRENMSDALTHGPSADELRRFLGPLGCVHYAPLLVSCLRLRSKVDVINLVVEG
jgi:hypothetical protein